jgi:hypothetical protein
VREGARIVEIGPGSALVAADAPRVNLLGNVVPEVIDAAEGADLHLTQHHLRPRELPVAQDRVEARLGGEEVLQRVVHRDRHAKHRLLLHEAARLVGPLVVARVVGCPGVPHARVLALQLIGQARHHVAVGTEACHAVPDEGAVLGHAHAVLHAVVEVVEVGAGDDVALAQRVDEGVDLAEPLEVVTREVRLVLRAGVQLVHGAVHATHDEEDAVQAVLLGEADDAVPDRRRGELAADARADQVAARTVDVAEVQPVGPQRPVQVALLRGHACDGAARAAEPPVGAPGLVAPLAHLRGHEAYAPRRVTVVKPVDRDRPPGGRMGEGGRQLDVGERIPVRARCT